MEIPLTIIQKGGEKAGLQAMKLRVFGLLNLRWECPVETWKFLPGSWEEEGVSETDLEISPGMGRGSGGPQEGLSLYKRA